MTSIDELASLAAAVTDAEQHLAHARAARDSAIASASAEGTRQRDIAEATGLTREQVRRIVRAAEEQQR